MGERRARKEKFVEKLKEAVDQYKNVIIVGVDNVGSNQMQKVRVALRGKAIVVMGKNTLIRKVLRDLIEEKNLTKLENLIPLVVGNMGFVFTNDNLSDIRRLILDNKVPAAAKCGTLLLPMSSSHLVQLDSTLVRPLSSRLSTSEPRSSRVPLKSSMKSTSSRRVTK